MEPFLESFENGCNEYIKKPFYLEELEIRLKKLLPKDVLSVVRLPSGLKFDKKNLELKMGDKEIHLRKKEKRLLQILVENCGNVVTSQELIDFIWDYEDREYYPLRQLVSSLKAKVPQLKSKIRSISGVGYKLENDSCN